MRVCAAAPATLDDPAAMRASQADAHGAVGALGRDDGNVQQDDRLSHMARYQRSRQLRAKYRLGYGQQAVNFAHFARVLALPSRYQCKLSFMRRIAVTSEKGGVGKSTLAFNLAGALAELGRTVLVDEDLRVRSCLQWAELAEVPFAVLTPAQAEQGLAGAAFLIVDSEGRPAVEDLVELATTFDRVLIPCGVSRLDVQNTLNLWRQLRAAADLSAVRVVITRAPPVGRVGQEARDALRKAGVFCLETVIRRYTAHERAAEVGGLVRDARDDRAGEAWADIQGVAAEVQA
jgi:chromosome partitioning protein